MKKTLNSSSNQFEKEMEAAKKTAGYRERYAMNHGKIHAKSENGERSYTWTYSTLDPYQDANGATYNASRGRWVN